MTCRVFVTVPFLTHILVRRQGLPVNSDWEKAFHLRSPLAIPLRTWGRRRTVTVGASLPIRAFRWKPIIVSRRKLNGGPRSKTFVTARVRLLLLGLTLVSVRLTRVTVIMVTPVLRLPSGRIGLKPSLVVRITRLIFPSVVRSSGPSLFVPRRCS